MNRRGFLFPWKGGNNFRLLIDGSEFFQAMLAAIDAAKESVLLELYLVESGQVVDRFIAALASAARRGVRVRLIFDDFGARLLLRSDRQCLLAAGVGLLFFNPLQSRRWRRNLHRDHRKLLVIDGQIAYTGGSGLSDAFDGGKGSDLQWHDLMLEIRGPVVADWQALFADTWRLVCGQLLDVPAVAPSTGRSDGHPGRVTAHGHLPLSSDIIRSLLKQLRRSRQRVWLATAYFLPSWKLRRALRRAARSGVDVRLLLPGPRTDHPSVRRIGHRHYGPLLRAGVRIYEFQPRFLHAKMQLCDNWGSIGSSNLDRWNLRWNLEAHQELRDPDLLARMEALFAEDFATSQEFDYEQWRRRPWYRRQVERLWGDVEALVYWLIKILQPRSPG